MGKTLLIYYENWGGQVGDKRLWTARFENQPEVWDYDSKINLIGKAKNKGLNYKVLRIHRNGSKSVVETNLNQVE